MDFLDVSFEENKGFILKGFDDAEKVVNLTGSKAKELADIALAIGDLTHVTECLNFAVEKNRSPQESEIFLRMALVTLMRCYGKNNARKTKLDIKEVLKDDVEGQECFSFYKSLRDKQIAHDENSLTDCVVGLVLNKIENPNKVAKIVTFLTGSLVFSGSHFCNLGLIVEKSLEYCHRKYDKLATELTDEFKKESYAALCALPELKYEKPILDEVHSTRKYKF